MKACYGAHLFLPYAARRREDLAIDVILRGQWRRRFPSRLRRHAPLPPSHYSSPARFPPGRPASGVFVGSTDQRAFCLGNVVKQSEMDIALRQRRPREKGNLRSV